MKYLGILLVLLLCECKGRTGVVGQKCKKVDDCKDGLICANSVCSEPISKLPPQNHTIDASLSEIVVDRLNGVIADDEDVATISVRLGMTEHGPQKGIAVRPVTDGDSKIDHFSPDITATDETGEAVFKLRSTKAGPKTITVNVGDFDQIVLGQKPVIEFVAGPPDPAHTIVTGTDARADGKAKAEVHLQLADKFGNIVKLSRQKLEVTLPSDSALHFDTLSGVSDSKGTETFRATSTVIGRQWFTLTMPQGSVFLPIRFLGAWVPYGDENQLGAINSLLVDPQNPDVLLIGTARGLFGTADYKKFTPYDDVPVANHSVGTIVADANKNVYIGTSGGVFRRETNGSWQPFGTSSPVGAYMIDLDPVTNDIYATDQSNLYRKNADSMSWEKISSGSLQSKFTPSGSEDFVNGVVACADGRVYVATRYGVFKKDGSAWSEIESWNGETEIYQFAGDSKCEELYLHTPKGVYRFSETEKEITHSYSMFDRIFQASGTVFLATANGFFNWDGKSWKTVVPRGEAMETALAVDPIDNHRFFTAGEFSGSVTHLGSPIENLWMSEDNYWVESIAVIDSSELMVFSNTYGMFPRIAKRTSSLWQTIDVPLEDMWDEIEKYREILFDKQGAPAAVLISKNVVENNVLTRKYEAYRKQNDGTWGLVGTSLDGEFEYSWRDLKIGADGRFYIRGTSDIFRSSLDLSSWSSVNSGSYASIGTDSAGNVYLCSNSTKNPKLYIKKPDDSWLEVTPAPPAIAFDFEFSPQDSSIMYMSDSSGQIFRRDQNGWSANLATGMPKGFGVRAIAVDPQSPDTVYVGVYGVGIYYTTTGGKL